MSEAADILRKAKELIGREEIRDAALTEYRRWGVGADKDAMYVLHLREDGIEQRKAETPRGNPNFAPLLDALRIDATLRAGLDRAIALAEAK